MEEKLLIPGTQDTPSIHFDSETGNLLIEGRSLPEDVKEFYGPIQDFVESYTQDPMKKTTLSMQLSYFNSASAKQLLDIFTKLLDILENFPENEVVVDWYYDQEDDDMLEAGEGYYEVMDRKLIFQLIPQQKDE